MKLKNEAELQKAVQDYLTENGFSYIHIPRNIGKYRNQLSGIFDLMCFGNGEVFFIELKNPLQKNYKLRKEQIKFENMLVKHGIGNWVSNDYEGIIKFIDCQI